MSTVEAFPGESKVEERTLSLARELADRRAFRMADLLIRYVSDEGPIPREGYRAILANEREEEVAEFLAKREAGLANDERSTSKGLTARIIEWTEPFFTSEEVREMLAGGYILDDAGQLGDLQLRTLTLPEGFYEETVVGIRFSVRGYVDETRVVGNMKDSFMIDRQNVVRIVGFNGDLWQNPRYNPNGTKRVEELMKNT